MNQITDPPLQHDFGLDFNYSSWSANSVITLTTVPWSNTYRDIVSFSNRSALNTYIDNTNNHRKHVISETTLLKPNQPITIDLPFNVASQFSYLRATNPAMPVTGDFARDYYYFILGVEYVAPNTTRILLELDVWSTYFTEVEIDRCYVERGHIGIANDQQFTDYGRKYLTIPEGLDIGAEYQPVNHVQQTIFNSDNREFDFLITSTTSLTDDPGTVQQPKQQASRGTDIRPFGLATESYIIKYADFISYINAMSVYPWIMQGVIEIMLIPRLSSLGIGSYRPVPQTSSYPPGSGSSGPSYLNRAEDVGFLTKDFSVTAFRNNFTDALPERYKHLRKFLTSPYTMLEMTTFNDNSVFYKPEQFRETAATFSIESSFMPGNAVTSARPSWYSNTYGSGSLIPGESKNYTCIYNMFPTFPIVTNNALIATANMARSNSQAYASADWAHQNAQAQNANAYDNATAGMDASAAQSQLGRDIDERGTAISNRYAVSGAATQVGAGALGGMMAGGGAGAAIGAAGGAASAALSASMNIARSNEELALRNAASIGSQNINTNLSATIRNNNASLGNWAAKGDYENQIAALNARSQDLQMTPASANGSLAGNFLDVLRNVHFVMIWRMVGTGALNRIGEYWLRYGYAVHSFLKPPANMKCMSKFTYWKMSETYLTAEIPEFYKNVIRGIFEKGTTVWSNPNDIGRIDLADNTPLSGIRY